MKLIAIMALMAMLLSIGPQSCSDITDQGNLTIGALLPLSGDYASIGKSAQIALELAEADINEALSDMGRSARIQMLIKDTKTDPEVTFEELKDFMDQGLKIIIGPEDSASLSRVREYANESGIILISSSSTAPSLAVANDTTFRFASDDTHLANVMAALMQRDGIKAVLPLAREDIWGNDLINATAKSLDSKGGVMLSPVKYNPNTKDFARTLADLRTALAKAINQYGNGSVAVDLIAFNEGTSILSQASGDPVLSSVRWYGSDPSAVSFHENEKAARFAWKVHFVYPTFGQENSTVYRRICEEVRQRYGIDAVTYAINDYDTAWMVAYVYLIAGSDDPAVFKKLLPNFAKTYRGYSGDSALNDAGDRAFAIYTIWSLKPSKDSFRNVPLTKYVFNPNEGAFWSSVEDAL